MVRHVSASLWWELSCKHTYVDILCTWSVNDFLKLLGSTRCHAYCGNLNCFCIITFLLFVTIFYLQLFSIWPPKTFPFVRFSFVFNSFSTGLQTLVRKSPEKLFPPFNLFSHLWNKFHYIKKKFNCIFYANKNPAKRDMIGWFL